MNERIGELLVKENLLSSEQLLKAREEAARNVQMLRAEVRPRPKTPTAL